MYLFIHVYIYMNYDIYIYTIHTHIYIYICISGRACRNSRVPHLSRSSRSSRVWVECGCTSGVPSVDHNGDMYQILGNPRFPLKGFFKGDIDIDIESYHVMDML